MPTNAMRHIGGGRIAGDSLYYGPLEAVYKGPQSMAEYRRR
jgi:hypothetical protein